MFKFPHRKKTAEKFKYERTFRNYKKTKSLAEQRRHQKRLKFGGRRLRISEAVSVIRKDTSDDDLIILIELCGLKKDEEVFLNYFKKQRDRL